MGAKIPPPYYDLPTAILLLIAAMMCLFVVSTVGVAGIEVVAAWYRWRLYRRGLGAGDLGESWSEGDDDENENGGNSLRSGGRVEGGARGTRSAGESREFSESSMLIESGDEDEENYMYV